MKHLLSAGPRRANPPAKFAARLAQLRFRDLSTKDSLHLLQLTYNALISMYPQTISLIRIWHARLLPRPSPSQHLPTKLRTEQLLNHDVSELLRLHGATGRAVSEEPHLAPRGDLEGRSEEALTICATDLWHP